MVSTSPTLLDKLRQRENAEAWMRFVRLYTPLLLHTARRQGFQDADAADLVQEVLVKLLQKLPEYQRGNGQSFRGWLSRVAANQCRDYRRRKATRPLPQSDDLPDPPAADEEIGEAEYRQFLVRRGLDLIRKDFGPETWAAFQGVLMAGRPAKVVAAELGVTENAVYLARNRVLTRLRQELDGLVE